MTTVMKLLAVKTGQKKLDGTMTQASEPTG